MWGLSDTIGDVLHHHNPMRRSEFDLMAGIICLSECLAHKPGYALKRVGFVLERACIDFALLANINDEVSVVLKSLDL